MGWSFKIARVSGIDIKVHVTFFLILIWGAAQWAHFGVRGYLFGVGFMLLLFLCVTLHELGHSVVAQRFGIVVRQIVLLPIGGVALLGRIPQNPWQELAIAVAGPLVNVVIAIALRLGFGINMAMGRMTWQSTRDLLSQGPSWDLMMRLLYTTNIGLVVFNMIPAFPLDGGRVLRSLLAMRMPWARATRAAATVGQVMAMLLGLFGLVTGSWMMVLVAIFVFLAAGAEAAEGQARTVLASARVGDAYNHNALVLSMHDRLSTAIRYILTSYQPDFAVIDGRQVVGLVTRADVIRALQAGLGDVPVTQIMEPHPVRVNADQTLDVVNRELTENKARVAAVYDNGHYLGLVSSDDIAEAYAVLQFMGGPARAAQAAPQDGGVVV